MPDEMEIVDMLISGINSGKYNANDKLPSENEMADRYGVPRITVRKAYERLQEIGYVYSKQGKGSFVKDRFRQIELTLSGDVSFSRKMADKGYNFQSKNIFCKEIKYTRKVFDALETDKNDRVFKIGRLRYVDGKPIALHISYVSKSVFNNIDVEGVNITSMFSYYNSKGYIEFCSKPSILSVTFPTKSEREVLECTYLIPLLTLVSGCMDGRTGTVLEYSKILYRSDCFSYVIL